MEGSKEKDSVKGKISHPGVFLKKVSLKISQCSQGNTGAGISFKYSCRSSACNFIKRETVVQMFSCGFCKIFKTRFFKYISGRVLLEEYWISLKMAPITIALKVSNAAYQKEFVLFTFCEICFRQFCENFYRNFYQSFSGTSVCSIFWTLKNLEKQLFPANCLSSFFSSSLMLKMSQASGYLKWKRKQRNNS